MPSTGEILTRSRLNYEALTELTEMGPSGGQHRIITGPMVTATDSAMPMGNSDDIAADIRVNDVNETPIPEPSLSIAVDSAVSDYAENQVDTTVGTYTVSGDSGATVTWSLSGADMGQFMLDGTGMSRMLKFRSAPDFEMPRGQAMSATNTNTYMVTVKVEAGGEMEEMEVSITVTNAMEAGTVTVSPTSPVVGSQVAATLTDPDGSISGLTWDWHTSTDMATWSAAPGTETNDPATFSSTYTTVADDVGKYLRATANYTDGFGSGNSAQSSGSAKVVATAVNLAPSFGADVATRSIAENTAAGAAIGLPVVAIDPNDDTLTYRLEGTDGGFVLCPIWHGPTADPGGPGLRDQGRLHRRRQGYRSGWAARHH